MPHANDRRTFPQPVRAAAVCRGLLAAATVLAAAGSAANARSPAQGGEGSDPAIAAIHFPYLSNGVIAGPGYPDPVLADKIWLAIDAFVEAHPPSEIYPVAGPAPPVHASVEAAQSNVEAACHDFPDLPDDFGPGAHHQACYEWVADYLALFHAARARHERLSGREGVGDTAWAQAYLTKAVDYMSAMIYGPVDSSEVDGFRDTRAAIWQNPMRAVNVAIVADLLRDDGSLDPDLRSRTEEVLSAVARAWYAEVWSSGVHPSHGVSMTTRTAAERPAFSLGGRSVTSEAATTFRWDADKGNSPSEESAWMGAGVMLATQVLQPRLSAEEADGLRGASRHYASFAVAFNRPDPQHGGVLVRTLNAETEGGAHGQRRLWIENHTLDAPSVPYLGWTWHYLDAALLASELGGQRPWAELVPDKEQWQVLLGSAEATLTAPDGSWLVDMTPGSGLGFDVRFLPLWTTSCGSFWLGRHYVRAGDGPAGRPMYVSEIGHPAGLDLVATAWPPMRIALDRGDDAAYELWAARLDAVLDESVRHPPDPAWAKCGVAPYVSYNLGYHWPRMLSMYVMAWLGASGFEVRPWASGLGVP